MAKPEPPRKAYVTGFCNVQDHERCQGTVSHGMKHWVCNCPCHDLSAQDLVAPVETTTTDSTNITVLAKPIDVTWRCEPPMSALERLVIALRKLTVVMRPI